MFIVLISRRSEAQAATTRAPIPPVNLKDRIAALQQRNAGSQQPGPRVTSPPPNPSVRATGSLRDKIASFEKKGAVPVPRGSFGLGAPPVDDGSSKRHGEMYGNRVPGLSRPLAPVPVGPLKPTLTGNGSTTSNASVIGDGSTSERRRRVSTSDVAASSRVPRSPPPSVSMDEDGLSSADLFVDVAEYSEPASNQTSDFRTHTGRRSVSDVLPKSGSFDPVSETLPEGEEETNLSGLESNTSAAPVIVVSSDSMAVEETPPGSQLVAQTVDDVGSAQGRASLPEPDVDCHDAEMSVGDLETTQGPITSNDASSPALSHPRRIVVEDSQQTTFGSLITHQSQTTSEITHSVEVHGPEIMLASVDDHPTRAIDAVAPAAMANISRAVSRPVDADRSFTSACEIGGLSRPVSKADGEELPVSMEQTTRGLVAVCEDDLTGDLNIEGDVTSVTDHTSASSSKVSTPSDYLVFPSAEAVTPMKSADIPHENFIHAADESFALDAQEAILVTDPPRVVSPPTSPAVLVRAPRNPPERRETNISDIDDLADQSLALDTGDAIIVTEPARIVSPIVTRGVLVPVPQGLSPVSSSTSSSPSPVPPITSYAELSLTPKAATTSFHAVVHGKVAQDSVSPPHRQESSYAPQRVRGTPVPPQSPGFDDLAALLADAALLEQQLSGVGTPSKSVQANTPPVVHVSDATPTNFPVSGHSRTVSPVPITDHFTPHGSAYEILVPERPAPVQEVPEPIEDIESSSEPLQEFPSIGPDPHGTPPKQRRSSRYLSDTPPPVPPKSPRPRYFSTLLSRRTSNGAVPMPGAYPRNSVCSEMSEDDSVLVSTPPTPPHDSFGSDCSSVRSSSRSWKMPKKSLLRATSFADRLWHNKRDSHHPHVAIATPDDEVHLSSGRGSTRTSSFNPPNFGVTPSALPQNRPSATERPTSWVSVSSVGSGPNGELLGSALFDAFPPVPDSVPPLPSVYLSSAGNPDSQSNINRSSSLPVRPKNHQKRRSAMA
ncbi:hypothetical protein AcV5_006305 [Taiwanofungus camphoratus]|nr:hypothetical protein AcV5_006305 [Antrodia cinnamomea]